MPIDHGTNYTGTVYQPREESEYIVACTSGMYLAHFMILIHELLNKYQYIVTEEAPIIILDTKSVVFMANNGKNTKHTRHIDRRLYFVRNGEK